MLGNPLIKKCFIVFHCKPSLLQLAAISSRPATYYLAEEANSHLAPTSFQVVLGSDKVTPEPRFLQAKQPKIPHSFSEGLRWSKPHKVLEVAMQEW